ncbi:hypothetical protein ElyMa_000648100 [Elysia marginata]|uniref:Uncharacterized protein n=1 Tax=Elysia marginata TaxID=1093978 RepID=A0AAV4GG37_9GAST|nr:hypothetical protein ElyMa_000648100 [Elysia marginata]
MDIITLWNSWHRKSVLVDQRRKQKAEKTAHPSSYLGVKTVVKGIYTQKCKTKNSNYSIRKNMAHSLPRKDQCVFFRPRTGHWQLRAHRYKNVNQPNCHVRMRHISTQSLAGVPST